jgi:F0F1-type ATP synthase assembly protein I
MERSPIALTGVRVLCYNLPAMSQTGDKSDKKGAQYAFNLTLVAVAGQVGCLTLVIVLVALFGGLWLDNRFGTRPLITVILMVGSVPVTLATMFWVVRKATSRITSYSPEKEESLEEDTQIGSESGSNT